MEPTDRMEAGVALYDQGRYAEADAVFTAHLRDNPGDPLALHELALTCYAQGNYDRGADAARAGLRVQSPHAQALYGSLGSCLSAKGDATGALEVFRTGIAAFPQDAHLQFNYGVSLYGAELPGKAARALERTIGLERGHTSARFVLARVYQDLSYRTAAIFTYLDFLAMAINGERGQAAARGLLDTLFSGATPGQDGGIDVHHTAGRGANPWSSADLFVGTQSALSLQTRPPGPTRAVDAAGLFMGLLGFIREQAELKPDLLTHTFVGATGIATALTLHRERTLERFFYDICDCAGLTAS